MPGWPEQDAELSPDEDLRRLQLRRLEDELWMRRVVLLVAVMLPLAGIAASILSPSVSWLLGIGAGSSLALPLAYFFGRRPPRSTTRTRRASPRAPDDR